MRIQWFDVSVKNKSSPFATRVDQIFIPSINFHCMFLAMRGLHRHRFISIIMISYLQIFKYSAQQFCNPLVSRSTKRPSVKKPESVEIFKWMVEISVYSWNTPYRFDTKKIFFANKICLNISVRIAVVANDRTLNSFGHALFYFCIGFCSWRVLWNSNVCGMKDAATAATQFNPMHIQLDFEPRNSVHWVTHSRNSIISFALNSEQSSIPRIVTNCLRSRNPRCTRIIGLPRVSEQYIACISRQRILFARTRAHILSAFQDRRSTYSWTCSRENATVYRLATPNMACSSPFNVCVRVHRARS